MKTTTNNPLTDLSEIDTRARWQQRPPNEFPSPWASEWGFDEYGLWQTFVVPVENGDDILHKMRFIPKGEFLMGSPVEEAEKNEDETQHHVTLTQGFWLGETTVSQALWQEVMGSNPSEFKEENLKPADNLPIESINWNDSQQFCQQINERISGLALCLPSEAQWEYACRAGSETFFNTGNNLTTGQANYNGNHHDSDDEKGKYRKRTMPLRSFSANGWGLYQMHGNLWELCQDIYAPFNAAIAIDPVNDIAVANNVLRVLRGGSWDSKASRCRSASRLSALAFSDIGLRVAQLEPSQQEIMSSEDGLSEIDPPRSKGDEGSAVELSGVEAGGDDEGLAIEAFKRQFRTHLNDKKDELVTVIEQLLTNSVGDFNEFDIEIDADSSTHYDVDYLACRFSSFEFTYDEKQEVACQIKTLDGNTIYIGINVTVYFNAQATFAFSVRDSIDKDYVGLGSSNKTVADNYETQIILTFEREHLTNIRDNDFDDLFVSDSEIENMPASINFGEIFPFMDDYGDEDEEDDIEYEE